MGATVSRDPDVVPVDLARFAKTWVEVARLPVWFQRSNTYGIAEYTVREDGRVGVTNTEMGRGSVPTGRTVHGIATPTQYSGQLMVSFGWFTPQGKYHVYWLDPNYTVAAVGSPDRRTLWILTARGPGDGDKTIEKAVAAMKQKGFNVDKLHWSC